MASRKLEKQIWREMRRIAENVPSELLKNLIKKEKLSPTLREVIDRAMGDPNAELTVEQRARFQALIDGGYLDREVEVVNPEAESALDAYYAAEVAYAVKVGRLPKEAPIPDFILKKGKKHAKRQAARLEELFSSEESAGPDAPGNAPDDAVADRERGPHDPDVQGPGEPGDGQGQAREV